jgi:hypothetical protein
MDEVKLKVDVGVVTKEGFTAAFLLRFDDGVMFRTHTDLLWCDRETKTRVLANFLATLAKLEAMGASVTGSENLDESK